jgi:hypothetical protein
VRKPRLAYLSPLSLRKLAEQSALLDSTPPLDITHIVLKSGSSVAEFEAGIMSCSGKNMERGRENAAKSVSNSDARVFWNADEAASARRFRLLVVHSNLRPACPKRPYSMPVGLPRFSGVRNDLAPPRILAPMTLSLAPNGAPPTAPRCSARATESSAYTWIASNGALPALTDAPPSPRGRRSPARSLRIRRCNAQRASCLPSTGRFASTLRRTPPLPHRVIDPRPTAWSA